MINSWDILRYLYFASCISMALYVMARSDQFLMSYGINKMEDKGSNKEPELSFTATMIVYILFSPILWLVILDQNNRKK